MKKPLANNWSYAYGQGDALPDEIDMTMATWATGPQSAASYVTPPADTKTTKFDVDVSKAGKKSLCRKCSRYSCFILLSVLFLLSLLALGGVLITWGLLTDGFKTLHEKLKDEHLLSDHQAKSTSNDESMNDICDTAECEDLAYSIENRLNIDADPCIDFLNYSCRQDKYAFVDAETVFFDTRQKTALQIKTILQETSTFNDTEGLISAKNFYQQCMSVEKIHSDGAGPLTNMIRTLGGCPMMYGSKWNSKNFKWEHVNAIMIRQYGVDSLLSFVVEPNNQNTTLNVIKVAPASESHVNSKISVAYGSSDKFSLYHANYQNTILKILKLIGQPPDDLEQQVKDVLLFEAHIVSKVGLSENPATAGKTNLFSLKELITKYNHIDWNILVEEVFRGITTINPDAAIFYVTDRNYLAFVNDIIKITDKKIVANFQLLSFIKAYILHVFPPSSEDEVSKRWMDCVEETTNFFPWTLSSEYIKTITGTRTKDEVELLVHNICRALERKIKKFQWMSQPVADIALNKIDGLSYKINYPESIVNRRQVVAHERIQNHTNNESYIELIAQLAAQKEASLLSRIKVFNDLDQWDHDSYPIVPEISLDLKTNTIIATAAALQEPIFSLRYPKYVLYSRAGFLIAKALWNSVSPAGSYYDGNGNWVQWYTNKTYESYNAIETCFLDPPSSSKKLPTSVRDQLIAQSMALDLAFQAYKIYLKDTSQRGERSLGHKLDVSNSQIFALSFFSMICSKNPSQNRLLSASDAQSHEYDSFILNSMFNNAKFVDSRNWNCSTTNENHSRYIPAMKDQCI